MRLFELIMHIFVLLLAIFYKNIIKFVDTPFWTKNPRNWFIKTENKRKNEINDKLSDTIMRTILFAGGIIGIIYTLYIMFLGK